MVNDLQQAQVWLTGIVLGAANAIPQSIRRASQGTITSPSGTAYQVLQKLGTTNRFNMYLCLIPSGQIGILKVASTLEQNDALTNEALILKLMGAKAEELEALNTQRKPLNYQNFFPRLHETFISEGQGGRRINILGFDEVIEDYRQLTPVSSLYETEKVRVDPRTSAWILGKLLKILAFSHNQGIANKLVAGSNVLIEKELHGVILLDWTLASISPNGKPFGSAKQYDIACAARVALSALGADGKMNIPPSSQLTDGRYEDFIRQLAKGGVSDTTMAHDRFYDLIWNLWGKGSFHPFTSHPVE